MKIINKMFDGGGTDVLKKFRAENLSSFLSIRNYVLVHNLNLIALIEVMFSWKEINFMILITNFHCRFDKTNLFKIDAK